MTLFFENKPTTLKAGDKVIHDSARGTFTVKRKGSFLRFENGEMAEYDTSYFDEREELKGTLQFIAACMGLQLSDDYEDNGRVASVTLKAPSKNPQ